MRVKCIIVMLLFLCLVPAAIASEGVVDIRPDWTPAGMRRVSIVRAVASSAFAGAQYEPARAIDGQRNTKWVAADEPSVEHPQSITLELAGSQTVSAVAVFGEAIGNDGIQDAEIQIASPDQDQFTTVGKVKNATSQRWLASFEPVRAKSIRLLVTRSGGPSTHTDVYEVEVYGPPLSPEESRNYAGQKLAACGDRWKEILATIEKNGPSAHAFSAGVADFNAARDSLERFSEKISRWETITAEQRDALIAQLDRFEARLQRIQRDLNRGLEVWAKRVETLEDARQQISRSQAASPLAFSREGDMLRVVNDRMMLVFHEADGTWDVIWTREDGAIVRRVGLGVEVDGRQLALQAAQVEAVPFSDARGNGLQLRQRWEADVVVERFIRVYQGDSAAIVSVQLTNGSQHAVSLGAVRMIDVREEGGGEWQLSGLLNSPACAGFPGASPPCRPSRPEDSDGVEAQYGSAGVLAFAHGKSGALVAGFLSSREGSPAISARFRPCTGGIGLDAQLSLGGRTLAAGQKLALDAVWLSVDEDRFRALERYGDAAAASTPMPVRTGANALWCSWYPLRMTISEDIVLANAAVAAEHFKPLGLDVMQLDHGWQQGDVCGDWFANERFPHGLKWLSNELQSGYGLRLGLWIAPTQVAVSSRLFQEHPEWMSRGSDGKPARFGKWFWVPNPEMAMLDASVPGANRWIEETFSRLSAEGSVYFKIDFIAGSPSLLSAMEAIRRGAGRDAWIRYCQTPSLLSAGLASSSYIGDDTGDAGLKDWLRLEQINSPLLAASYWANDRLYHREVCDMSVGAGADVEEARFKLSLMTMAGCSISFSDDLRKLDVPRIRMMQQCLPPGNPLARPLDLFDRERPSLWHMHCARDGREWDAVGVFNFEDEAQERVIDLAQLGLPRVADVAAFEFWEEKYLGVHRDRVAIVLPPRSARIVLLHRLPAHPDVIATDMHVLGGYHEITAMSWNSQERKLSGHYQRMPGARGKAFLYVPDGYRPRAESTSPAGSSVSQVNKNLWSHEIEFTQSGMDWAIEFDAVAAGAGN